MKKKGSISSAILWMLFISMLLFWLPGIGSLVAGLVGGKKAGSVGRGIIAVFLPGILFGVILFLYASLLVSVPLIGIVAGLGGFSLAISHVGPLLLGAILGGFFAEFQP